MPKLTAKTRRIILVGIVILSIGGYIVGEYEIPKMGLVGLLAIMNSDKDTED